MQHPLTFPSDLCLPVRAHLLNRDREPAGTLNSPSTPADVFQQQLLCCGVEIKSNGIICRIFRAIYIYLEVAEGLLRGAIGSRDE